MLLPGNCSPQQGMRQACLASRHNREAARLACHRACYMQCLTVQQTFNPLVGWLLLKFRHFQKIELHQCTVAQTGRVSVDPFKIAHNL